MSLASAKVELRPVLAAPPAWRLAMFAAALVAVAVLALGIGPVRIAPGQVLGALLQSAGAGDWGVDQRTVGIIMALRLPRLILAALVGAALALCGAVMQGMFRNPLADPGLLGVSSGAALGAVATIVMGTAWLPAALAGFAQPLAAFAGALAATLVIQRISTFDGRTLVATMLLGGIAINALGLAGTNVFVYASDERQLRDISFWTMGSVGGATWSRILFVLPFVVLPVAVMPLLARGLNALILGEREAGHLGVPVEALKRIAVVLVALAVGAAVSVSGIIAFVGLLVPHLVRLLFGPDHRLLLPASTLLGATLLIAADALARVAVAPAELPIGLLTSLIGGPFFIALLLRERRRIDGP